MLKIQKASAGSGKTFTLAKNFIINLIAYKTEDNQWRLRNEKQITDALRHILAITFTNKATNEMKQRIVANLSLLARVENSTLSEINCKKIPYLEEIHELTGQSYQKIGKTAKEALRVVLNDYTYFKISTIDSFFQEILRIFTYEANINETYQVEIDSSYITESAIDAAFHELDTHPAKMGAASFWLSNLMSEEAKKNQLWNPFSKRSSSRSIYSKIRKALLQLEREDFKEIKEVLYEYFEDQANIVALVDLYKTLKIKQLEEKENLLKKISSQIDLIKGLIDSNGFNEKHIKIYFLNHLNKVSFLKKDDKIDFNYNSIYLSKTVFKGKNKNLEHPLDKEAMVFYDLLSEWSNPLPNSFRKIWEVYGSLLPYLGLILEIRRFINQVLDTNNLIQLSETGYILKKIIGEDDAPFVFERLGNRLDNYLIDEFQDTSRMQWEIIRPLLGEGLAKDKGSLIIGDPKQSIYRFRNADHRLIMEEVPKSFPFHEIAGNSKADNTNWRSHTNIVKFNNYFFKSLAEALKLKSIDQGDRTDFVQLYSNVVQHPHNSQGKGYVEINFISKSIANEFSPSADSDTDDKDWFYNETLRRIAPLVSSLKKRGYQQKDIGILVNTNANGTDLIESFIRYNDTHPDDKIDFISDESLLISSSLAVNFVLGVLKKIGTASSFEVSKEDVAQEGSNIKTKQSRYLNWRDLKINFEIYSRNKQDLSPIHRLISFLENPQFDDSIPNLIANLPTPTVGAITEAIIKTFISEDLRKKDAIYLASFQDLVSEYSHNHFNEPLSFLEWWDTKADKATITSPDGIDAVQIMTIHKSKGLEFKCVILPFATDSLLPSIKKEEWRWVKPEYPHDIKFPPFLPISTNASLKGSIHEDLYKEYVDQVITDTLNMYYVAFTRAKNELFVFTKEPTKQTKYIQDYLFKILTGEVEPGEIPTEEKNLLLMPENMNLIEDRFLITAGLPFTTTEILEEYKEEREKTDKGKETEIKFFNDYYVNSRRPKLRSTAKIQLPSDDF